MPARCSTGRPLAFKRRPTLIQPYNRIFAEAPGDSRTAQSGGLTGTYGTTGITNNGGTAFAAWLPMLMNNAIRFNNMPNAGIGGQTGAQALAYPRPLGNLPWTGRIDSGTAGTAGNTLTISAGGGIGDNISVGTLITGTGITPCTVTAILTGSGAVGTYTVDGAPQNVASTATIQRYYPYGHALAKTIADIAANEAAIVFLWVGTNSSNSGASGLNSDLAAIDTTIRALTNPSYVHPGYGAPLPLYAGNPKTVVVLNETRRGISAAGTVNQQLSAANATAFLDFSNSLKRYSFDSSDPSYANPHVVVVDTFNNPATADLTDSVTLNPKAGYFADGLHLTPPGGLQVAKAIAARLAPLLTAGKNFAVLPTTDTAANFYIPNPCFTLLTGGAVAIGSNTLVGSVPSGWRMIGSGSGLTYTITSNPLGGNLGNEIVLHITGTPAADTTIVFDNTSTTALKAAVNLATDTMRGMANVKLAIASGLVSGAYLKLTYQGTASASSAFNSAVGGQGGTFGYGNVAAYSLFLLNSFASTANSAYLPYCTKNANLAPYGATGTPPTLDLAFTITVSAGTAVDVTLTISQAGIAKVTD